MIDRLPRFKAWWGKGFYNPKSWMNGGNFEFGFIAFPYPENQQVEGELIKARIAFRICIAGPVFHQFYPSCPFEGQEGVYDSHAWTGLPYLKNRLVKLPLIQVHRW